MRLRWPGPARRALQVGAVIAALAAAPVRAMPQADSARTLIRSGDSVTVRFINAEIAVVLQALGRHLPKPLLVNGVGPMRLTLDHPTPIAVAAIPGLIQGIAASQNLEFTEEASFYQIAPLPQAAPVPETGAARQPQELNFLRLKHARAADVAATVNLLFGGGGDFSGRAGLSTGTLSDELRRNLTPPAAPRPGVTEVPSAGAAGQQAALSGPVTIVPDELTNALLVRASRLDFEVIQGVVTELDIRPLQVLIEVLIVEARRDKDFSLGALLDVKRTDGNNTYQGGFGSAGVGDLVIQFMRMGRTEINAVLGAAETRGEVDIVSRPVILTANNTEARFLVGSQRPFVQVSRSLPTDAASRDQVVQYRDVGTKLTVLPTINQDGYVTLLIQQEISAATSETQFNAPIISTREARTHVLVRDSQTIVLGGLKDQQREKRSSGIPVLSGIPLIGGLFGSSSRHSASTELYLFLTPRIVRTDEDADSLTAARLRRIPGAHD